MYTVYEKKDGEYVATIHGSEEWNKAVEQMALLCGEEIKAWQLEGKRATLEAGNWDGYLVFQVVNKHTIVKQYGIRIA